MSTSIPNNIISTFGGIPNLIRENIIDLKVKGENYCCDLCETEICCVSDNKHAIDTHLTNHLHSNSHQFLKIERQKSIKDFEVRVKEMFHNTSPKRDISPIIFVNLPFLMCDEKTNKCALCDQTIHIATIDPVRSEEDLVRHLLSDKHKVKIIELYDKSNKVKVQLEKVEVYGMTPPPVVNNIEFIVTTFGDCNYYCNLCLKNFNTKDNTSVEQFLCHLRSSDHKKKADERRVVVKLPEIAKLFKPNEIPHYIVNNIEDIYIKSRYPKEYCCSLCNKTITAYEFNKYKTLQNFKHHFLSHDHEDQFFSKLDPQNKAYRRLHKLFEGFPLIVQKDLKYMGLRGTNLYCLFCNTEILIENDDNDTKKNILAHFLIGEKSIECSSHRENWMRQKFNKNEVKADLRKIFGSIPDYIQQSVEYLSVSSPEEKYLLCITCKGNKKLQLTKSEIMKHLTCVDHKSSTFSLQNKIDETEKALCEHFTLNSFKLPPEMKVFPIPRFMKKDVLHVSYKDTSDIKEYDYTRVFPLFPTDDSSDEEDYRILNEKSSNSIEKQRVKGKNFQCNICYQYNSKPSVILIGKGLSRSDSDDDLNRKQTEYNFRTHFLSQEHKHNLKRKESERVKTHRILEQVFGDIPNYARNNIHLLFSCPFNCYCILCEGFTHIENKSSFEAHFIGRDATRPSYHSIKESETELSNSRAMDVLEMKFPQVPRVVLRDIDFLSESGGNLFCDLCQEILFIEGYDLEKVNSDLCWHMRSEKHMFVVNGIRQSYQV